MKYITLLFLAVILFSCCGTKKAIENTPKKHTKEIVEIKPKTPIKTETKAQEEKIVEIKIPESPKPPKLEEINVIDHYKTEEFNHSRWNKLLQKNVSTNGNVDYSAFKNDPIELQVYIDSLGENPPNNLWSKEDKLAYWINAYNALTIDLIIRNYPIKSIKDIKNPWDQRLWKLGTKWINLNDIEHQILRKMDEPRIHFAIVCASFSCPKLQNEAFTAININEQLTTATKDFLNDTNRNNISSSKIKISKIFQWFSKDFKDNGTIIDFLNQYSDIKISSKAKKSYMTYNWDLNE